MDYPTAFGYYKSFSNPEAQKQKGFVFLTGCLHRTESPVGTPFKKLAHAWWTRHGNFGLLLLTSFYCILNPSSIKGYAMADLGGYPPASSMRVFDVTDPAYGAKGDGVADDSLAQYKARLAIVAAGGGKVYFPPGEFYKLKRYGVWTSIPEVTAGRGWIVFSGYGATIHLEANNSTTWGHSLLHVFDEADQGHKTYGKVVIEGFTVDAADTIGSFGVIFNCWANHVNVEDMVIKDCIATNLTTLLTGGGACGIKILAYHTHSGNSHPGETTQDHITNILIDNVKINGGNQGIVVGGLVSSPDDKSLHEADVWLDNITIRDCFHDTQLDPGIRSAYYPASSNIQIGADAYGGKCTIENCIGKHAGDTGIEVNNMNDILVENCREENGSEMFYAHNYAIPKTKDRVEMGQLQQIVFKDCVAVNSAEHSDYANFPFATSQQYITGIVTFDHCKWQNPGGVVVHLNHFIVPGRYPIYPRVDEGARGGFKDHCSAKIIERNCSWQLPDQVQTGNELVYNGNFLGTRMKEGVWSDWAKTVGSGAIDIETSFTPVPGSDKAAKLTRNGADNTNLYQSLLPVDLASPPTPSIVAHHTYKLAFATAGDGMHAGQYAVYDIDTTSYIVARTSTGITAKAYQLVEVSFTPSASHNLRLYFYPPAANGYAYFSHISLRDIGPQQA